MQAKFPAAVYEYIYCTLLYVEKCHTNQNIKHD